MGDFKITYIGDTSISNVHHVGIEHNGNYYSIIYGKYVNGGFCSIPNWNVGCELAQTNDILWNSASIGKTLKNVKAGKAIAKAIAEIERNREGEASE